eukprot:4628611-Prymnesium_polylepis.1
MCGSSRRIRERSRLGSHKLLVRRRVRDGFATDSQAGFAVGGPLVCCVTVLSRYRQTRPTSMTFTMTLRTWSSTLMNFTLLVSCERRRTGRFQGIRLSREGRPALGSGPEDVRAGRGASAPLARGGRPSAPAAPGPRATASGRHVPHGAG